MNFNPLHYPHNSQRNAVYAKNGMVATSQYFASQAGINIMQKGGNAIDAAVATAAALTVVEPTSNGIGSDAFAIIWHKGKLHGINGSGPAPQSISIDALKDAGHTTMPTFGMLPVTVPGAVATWATLIEKFGNLTLAECLAPAIKYAEEGYPISPTLGYFWNKAYTRFKNEFKTPEYNEWFKVFAPKDRVPNIGEVWSSTGHAKTLQEIGATNGTSFYKGDIAKQIDTFFKEHKGYLTYEDMAAFAPEFVEPISVAYNGYDVWEIPPNGQGIIAQIALGIMQNFKYENTTEYLHKQIEAMKQAFAIGRHVVTDPAFMKYTPDEILNPTFLQELSKKIKPTAQLPEAVTPNKSGTVYLSTADAEGNMVSFIQSNYMGFGSGIVVPGTGIAMQNRGHDFSLDPAHINALQGGKKTLHTIIPGFITKDNQAVASFGVMGGYMQPQGHLQVVCNLLDKQLNPQAALDAPRWQWMKENNIEVEQSFAHHTAKELAAKGHNVTIQLETGSFGRGQIIMRDPKTGVLVGGCEMRADSTVGAW